MTQLFLIQSLLAISSTVASVGKLYGGDGIHYSAEHQKMSILPTYKLQHPPPLIWTNKILSYLFIE